MAVNSLTASSMLLLIRSMYRTMKPLLDFPKDYQPQLCLHKNLKIVAATNLVPNIPSSLPNLYHSDLPACVACFTVS